MLLARAFIVPPRRAQVAAADDPGNRVTIERNVGIQVGSITSHVMAVGTSAKVVDVSAEVRTGDGTRTVDGILIVGHHDRCSALRLRDFGSGPVGYHAGFAPLV